MIRKWISFVVMLAFVVTVMPTLSHASMSMGHKTVSAHAHKHHCCPDMAQKNEAKKVTSTDQQCPMSKKSCCDTSACKCLGNACGSIGILGFNSAVIVPATGKNIFIISQDRFASSLSERIKRPPRV